MDISKLTSDEVNREIAKRRGEWIKVRLYGHWDADHTHFTEDGVGEGDQPLRVPQLDSGPDYLKWVYCGPLLEEALRARLGWRLVEDDYGCAVRDRYNVPITSPYRTITDAIRRAWLKWNEEQAG